MASNVDTDVIIPARYLNVHRTRQNWLHTAWKILTGILLINVNKGDIIVADIRTLAAVPQESMLLLLLRLPA